jgi:predicted ABC-class ATPase
VGGGYHGKSTLLRALERGVYPHIPGDGRETVVTDSRAVKIRAEDGRRVEGVAIEPFVRNLPLGRDTKAFRSDDASGSTSQAASVMEAVEVGASALLMDEDSCATNFMTRDARMQALVAPEREPITPLVDRVRELFADCGVSTLLVAGSSGDFFAVADTVIEMENFLPRDRSAEARQLAATEAPTRAREAREPFRSPTPRIPDLSSLEARDSSGRSARVGARGLHQLRYGKTELDLRGLEQLLDPSQTRALGQALRWIANRGTPEHSVVEHLRALDALLDAEGVEALSPAPRGCHPGALARPRRFEIAGALNRLRTLRVLPGPE